MRSRLSLMLVVAALAAPAGADHLVASEAIRGRLREAAAQRERDLAAVDGLLSSSRADQAAAAIGADLSSVRAGLSTLSDAELRELAARATALEVDPAAGRSYDTHDLLVILLIVLIVIVVLKAV